MNEHCLSFHDITYTELGGGETQIMQHMFSISRSVNSILTCQYRFLDIICFYQKLMNEELKLIILVYKKPKDQPKSSFIDYFDILGHWKYEMLPNLFILIIQGIVGQHLCFAFTFIILPNQFTDTMN